MIADIHEQSPESVHLFLHSPWKCLLNIPLKPGQMERQIAPDYNV